MKNDKFKQKLDKVPIGKIAFTHKSKQYIKSKDNEFQTEDGKIAYEYRNGKFHLISDERLPVVISFKEATGMYVEEFNNLVDKGII